MSVNPDTELKVLLGIGIEIAGKMGNWMKRYLHELFILQAAIEY